MPDFDAFERLIRQSMVVEEEAIRELVHEMAETPGENRPKLFKCRSVADLDAWVRRARTALADQFGVDARFATTHRNLEGSDLVLVGTDIEIELKTGQVTDANIGIKPMSWAFHDEDPWHIEVITAVYELANSGRWIASMPTCVSG